MARMLGIVAVLVAIAVAWLPARADPATLAGPEAPAAPAATFQVQYTTPANGGACTGLGNGGTLLDFPPARQAELEAATAAWGAVISSSVPIVVQACWASALYDPGALGTGAPTTYALNPSGAIFSDTFYPIALANARAGVDLAPGQTDMVLTFLTGNPIFGTALHELGHGLGFEGRIDVTGGPGANMAACSSTISMWSPHGSCPTPYDRLATDGAGRLLLSYNLFLWSEGDPSGSPLEVGAKLTSGGDAYLGGPNASIQNGGNRVKLYTPYNWTNSSYSHVDNLPGYDALMEPTGGANGVGPITTAMMRDLGWPLTSTHHQVDISGAATVQPGVPITLTATYSPSGAANPTSITWTATDQTDYTHTPSGKTDQKTYTWATAGKKRIIVTATGSTGQVAGLFEVNVATSATATPTATVSPTRTPTPTPTATPRSRSFLPFIRK